MARAACGKKQPDFSHSVGNAGNGNKISSAGGLDVRQLEHLGCTRCYAWRQRVGGDVG